MEHFLKTGLYSFLSLSNKKKKTRDEKKKSREEKKKSGSFRKN